MCLTEHHLHILEETYVNIEGYAIGAQFCRVLYEKVGVIIYVHSSLQYMNIDLSEYCKQKDIEICAVKLIINSLNMFIIATLIIFYNSYTTFFNLCLCLPLISLFVVI
jgi:hypothetical protein